MPADLVLIGIGAVPETGLAAAAGLDCDNGIAVIRPLQTSDPDIFAAGDCCSFPLASLWLAAACGSRAGATPRTGRARRAEYARRATSRMQPCPGSGPISMT